MLVVACFGFSATAAQAAPQWFAPATLSASGQDGFDAQIATTSSGEAVAVWSRFDGTVGRIQAAIRAPGAASFGPVATISAAGQPASRPDVAITSTGAAVAVWERSDGTKLRTEAAFRAAGGSFPASGTVISAAGQDAFEPKVAMDSTGNAFMVWTRYDGTNGTTCCTIIQAAVAGPGGPFASPENISQTGQNANEPQIGAESNGEATAVWSRSDGTKLRVQSARLRASSGYPRPNGAAKVRVSLLPAMKACTAPNTAHGGPAPFDKPSCSPAVPESDQLTAPNDDTTVWNGITTYKLVCDNGGTPPDCGAAGDQADISVVMRTFDARCRPGHSLLTSCGTANTTPGEDYTGNLLTSTTIEMTDLWSAGGPATTVPFELPVGYGCAGTPTDLARGSTCILTTALDAMIPDFVKENKRALWEFRDVKVYDAGANGTFSSGTIAGGAGACPPSCLRDGDEKVYLREGIFIP